MNPKEKEQRPAVLSFRGVQFTWPGGETSLFNDLELDIFSGEAVCLIGPNGSGKTTLMELALGWRRPLRGRVLLDGRSVARLPAQERGTAMALVPQEEKAPFAVRVRNYVLLGRIPHKPPLALPDREDGRIVEWALNQVNILDLADREISRLSGGERRLVLIARALAQKPRLLLLDEPANHLDPANRERVLELLRGLSKEGVTLLMSSHEPDMVSRLAHRVFLLRRGGAPLSGDANEILSPQVLTKAYGVPARIVEAGGRRIILWGRDPKDRPET